MKCQKDKRLVKKNWILIFFLIQALFIYATTHVSFSKNVVRLYFFYSEESGGLKVEEAFIKPLSKKYSLEIESLSLNKLDNYDLLSKFEKELKHEGSELPVVIIGNKILGGEAEIRKELEGWVKSYAEKGGVPWPSLQVTKTEGWIPHAITAEDKDSKKIIYAAYFYLKGCLDCEKKMVELEKWAHDFPDLRIKTFDSTKEENKSLDEALSEMHHVPEYKRGAFRLYIGEDCILEDTFSHENFQRVVSKYSEKGSLPPWEKVTQEALLDGERKIIERFKKFSLSGVLIAGLIDGLNPCAFATIVFLVSYLAFLGKKGREILTYGIIFTSGVFVAYLLAGVGLMAGLRQLSGFPKITRGIYLAIAIFTFTLGIISLYDYILFRRGQMEKMKLQLPVALKKKVHRLIRKGTQSQKAGFLGTFALGFVIAATEVVCTGQLYLPTIGYIMTIPKLRAYAFLNLLLYNVMFIIPLVGVFVAAFMGITSERMALETRRRTGTVKLLTAILFMSLGVFLFFLR